MNWQKEHRKRVASFPEDVREAHKHSSNHRRSIEESEYCGCFYCCAIFAPNEIVEWIDKDENGIGQTALCPSCGIDSIIGSKSGFPINVEFMTKMKQNWF